MSSRKPGSGKGPVAVAIGVGKTSPGGTIPAEAELSDLESGLEATVCAYLKRQPDFFTRNPDLLAFLEIPHVTGGAVSLIEHQVGVLRRQLQTERGRLSHLITRAREYEVLSNRLHALVLQIIPAKGLEGLCQTLHDTLTSELSADAVALRLFPFDPEGADDQDPVTLAFRDFLEQEHALCGPLEAEKSAMLFGETAEQIHSTAIMPIRAEGRSGVLAIGAADPDRFGPDMGTDLLDRLAEIVSCKLVSLPDDDLAAVAPAGESAAHVGDPEANEASNDTSGEASGEEPGESPDEPDEAQPGA